MREWLLDEILSNPDTLLSMRSTVQVVAAESIFPPTGSGLSDGAAWRKDVSESPQ